MVLLKLLPSLGSRFNLPLLHLSSFFGVNNIEPWLLEDVLSWALGDFSHIAVDVSLQFSEENDWDG